MINETVIVQHPVPVCVPLNYTVTLSVRAVGVGSLCYQWFQSEDEQVPGAREANLVITAEKSQLYVCRVNDVHHNCVFTKWVKVKVLDIARPGLPEGWQGDPHIAVQPLSQGVRRGGRVTLRCSAFGIPAPQYQWYRNGIALRGGTRETLLIENVAEDHEGSYLCAVSNDVGEKWTEPAEISLVGPDNSALKRLTATDKVALLIGNLNYANHPVLMAPMMDVHELANHLRELGFRVVSLLDLSKAEMQAAIDEFLLLLDRGVYAVFYYAGHGYEYAGRNYLVATDAPQPYRPVNCVCVQRVMQSMQEKRTALNVVLLDTCRKWYNQQFAPSEIRSLAPLGNTVYGYATCEDAEAFEVQDGGRSTGVFTKYLNKNILRPDKVTRVLEQVSEDLGGDPLITGKQVVEIKHTLKDPRALTDPIRTTGHTKELRLREECWRQANELPRRQLLAFSCGVEVELSFSALFSNVLVVFATVKSRGPRALDYSVCLSSSPVLEDFFSVAGISDEMDSLLLNSADTPDCSLRLCGLQQLRKSLVITVDLHYTHEELKVRLMESRQLKIGRPLVARCELHKRNATEGAAGRDGSPFLSVEHHQLRPRQRQGCRPSTRKAENVSVNPATRPSAQNNEPEENDENELQGYSR